MRHVGAALFLVLFSASPTFALENIDDVYWFMQTTPPSSPRTGGWVSFDATITATDRAEGLTFTLAERDADGLSPQTVWHYVLDEYGELPSTGTRVHVTVSFGFFCDPKGRLLHAETATWLNYCGAEASTYGSYQQGVGWGFVGDGIPVEAYEFTLVDEQGIEAPDPTPEDFFVPCVTPAAGTTAAGAEALEDFTRARSAHIQAAQKAGDSGSVGIYFDAEGTICSGTVEPGVPTKIYVIAKLQGITDCGIAGAEFRFSGIPESWQVSPVPSPEIISLGNPLRDGTTLAMSCQAPENGRVVLYEVEVLATKVETDVTFKLEPHVNPAGDFGCPLLVLCDWPFFTQVCVESIPCYFNASSAKSCDGAVPIEDQTWSHIKQLFR